MLLSPLGFSYLLSIYADVDIKPNASSDVPFHKTIYQYNKADMEIFRVYNDEAPLLALYKKEHSRRASLISERVMHGIWFLSHTKKAKKLALVDAWVCYAMMHAKHY